MYATRRRFALTTAVSSIALVVGILPAQGEQRSERFDIPAQPLNHALLDFSRQANIDVIAPTQGLRGKRTSAVAGELSPDEALERLLENSGMRYTRAPDGTIIIERSVPSGGSGMQRSQDRTQMARLDLASASGRIAQQATAQPNAAAQPGGQPRQIEEIVVTSQRREQTLEQVPISVEAMSAEELQVANVTNMEELAFFSPSLNFTDDVFGTNVNFAIRGLGSFAPQGNIEPAVGVVFNGIPLSRAAEFTAELDDIERVEILKGPQGSLFGASTTGGVVNIVPRMPVDEFEARFFASATDDEEFTAKGMINIPFSDEIAGRFNVVFKDRDAHIKNLFPGKNDIGKNETFLFDGKLNFRVSDDVNFLLGGFFRDRNVNNTRNPTAVETDDRGPARLAALGFGDPELGQEVLDDLFVANTDQSVAVNQDNWMVFGDLTWDISSSVTLKWLQSIVHFDQPGGKLDGQLDIDGTPAGFPGDDFGLAGSGIIIAVPVQSQNTVFDVDGNPAELGDAVQGRSWDYITQELRFEGTGGAVDWTAGFFYRNHNEKFVFATPFVRGGVFNSAARWSDVEQQRFSLFADATWHATDTIHIFGGLRGIQQRARADFKRLRIIVPQEDLIVEGDTVRVPDSVDRTPDVEIENAPISPTGWAGRAGFSWDMSQDLDFLAGNDISVYFNASRGFTGFGTNTGNSATLDSLFLLPSTSRSFEVGSKAFLFNRSMNINMALFKMRVSDFQANVIPGAGQLRAFTPGDFQSRGFEAELTWLVPGIPFTIDGSLTLLKTDLREVAPQPCFPGQTLEQGCFIEPETGQPRQDINGRPGFNAPSKAFNVTGTYDFALSRWTDLPLDAVAMLSYTWKDDVVFNFDFDPLGSFQEEHGLLDFTLAFLSVDGRYRFSVFGKNILDKEFVSNRQSQSGTQGRGVATVGRSAQSRWGVSLGVNF